MPRPKGFEPETAVHDAMMLFWRQGYEMTSIPQLERHLGINRFSIYDTFESKRELFIRALERYTEMLRAELLDELQNGESGLSDIREFFDRLRALLQSEDAQPGCMLINTAIEIGTRDPEILDYVQSYFADTQAAFLAAFERARKLGEIHGTARDLEERARALRSALGGVLVQLRLTDDPRTVDPTIAAIVSQFLTPEPARSRAKRRSSR